MRQLQEHLASLGYTQDWLGVAESAIAHVVVGNGCETTTIRLPSSREETAQRIVEALQLEGYVVEVFSNNIPEEWKFLGDIKGV
jgi:hypothetical protein